MLSMTTAALALALQAAPAAPTCPLALAAGNARAWVYRAPSVGARKTARLRPGSPLFICGENAGWFLVYYPDQRHACRGTTNGLDVRAASTCANGWLPRHHVAVVKR